MKQSYQHIILEELDGCWQVWLNRPEKLNALNNLMIEELIDVFSQIDGSKTRFVVLRGRGKSFCVGADIGWMKNAYSMTMEENIRDAKKLAELLYSLYNLSVPVLAIAHGDVYGGGIGLLSACDFVWAEKEASFCFSEGKLGLSPSTIMPYVLNRVSKIHAKELIFTAKIFDAEEAVSKNIVDKIIEQNQVEKLINSYLLQIMNSAPGAVKESKRLINLLDRKIDDNMIDLTVRSLAERRSNAEAIKGINAFLKNQKLSWD